MADAPKRNWWGVDMARYPDIPIGDPDDICRAQPLRGGPCPRCGYESKSLPSWVDYGATFALNGTRYRVKAIGSTNRYAPRSLHFEDTALCERVGDVEWNLPDVPCPVSDVKQALGDLFSLPMFRSHELTEAYFVEPRRGYMDYDV